MAVSDLLQKLLSLGLLDIGDDDTRLTKLQDAAKDLQQTFSDQPHIGLWHALMVYSGNVDPNDPCFAESAQVLSKHWPTYRNRYTDVPRAIFRGISLQAVDLHSTAHPDF